MKEPGFYDSGDAFEKFLYAFRISLVGTVGSLGVAIVLFLIVFLRETNLSFCLRGAMLKVYICFEIRSVTTNVRRKRSGPKPSKKNASKFYYKISITYHFQLAMYA